MTIKPLYSLLAAGTIALASFSANAADLSKIPSGDYTVDPTHAYVTFQYSHLGLSNPTLSFGAFEMSLALDVEDPTKSEASLVIKTDSVNTGSDIFHEHLTGEKWFDASAHPEIAFKSTAVTANADGTFSMTGDLTIKDVTKPVTLDVVVNGAMMHPMAKKPVIGVTATGNVLRSEWGLGANAPFISDEVTLNVTAELLTDS